MFLSQKRDLSPQNETMKLENKEKILEVFYENPAKSFTVREISKLTKVPRATVHKKLVDLKKRGLVDKENRAGDGLLFKTKKINFFIEKIIASGLIDEIVEKMNPSCIILFGSIRKGDSVKESDIDLFVESFVKEENDLSKYEKELGHEIQLHIRSDMHKLQENLFNNVVNGIKLYGSFKIK